MTNLVTSSLVASGRYAIYHDGRECGEERWRIEGAGDGLVATGEQIVGAPHPFPNRQEYRVTLRESPRVRVTGLEILWTVGPRTLRSTHAADAARWRLRIEAGGQVREQEGDYPDACEVDYGTPLFHTFMLARYAFQPGSEIEFPVLRIGPPLMAVTPARERVQCVEVGERDSALGRVSARRYVRSLPDQPEEGGLSFWADERDVVLEMHAGFDASRPWMRLVELRR